MSEPKVPLDSPLLAALGYGLLISVLAAAVLFSLAGPDNLYWVCSRAAIPGSLVFASRLMYYKQMDQRKSLMIVVFVILVVGLIWRESS